MAFYTQNITGTAKTEITTTFGRFDSLSLTAVTAASVSLYLTSIDGSAVTTTAVAVNNANGYPVSTGFDYPSTTVTVDTTTATDALLLNEKVFKSDGTLFGTCTSVASGTSIVFSGGIENAMTNNDVLFTGTKYYILKTVTIPLGATLVLGPEDINFNRGTHKPWIILASGSVDLITRQ